MSDTPMRCLLIIGTAAWLFPAQAALGIHNSLLIRQRLQQANSDPLRVERRNPHRGVCRDPKATPGPGDFEMKGRWRVQTEVPEEYAALVREDVADFLRRMGVDTSDAGDRPIRLRLAKDLAQRGFRVECRPDGILIEGGDAAGVWAGIAWWERQIRVRRGPFLPLGKVQQQAAWRTQISQGPWGGNYSVPDFSPEYLSDDAFRLYAHYGVNSMMIYGDVLCYVKSTVLPELNHPDYEKHVAMLRDAVRRAARYGVRFTYVPVGPKLRPGHAVFQNHPELRGAVVGHGGGLQFLCSSSETTLKFYEELFGNLCREVKDLAAVVLITYSESWYHCRMWDSQTTIPCARCVKIPVHEMTARFVEAVDRGVRQGCPDALTAQWIYTWGRGDRREGFRPLARQIGVFHHVEKDYSYRKPGYTKSIWDYSIDYPGPSPEMQKLADFAHQTGRPLLVKTETGIGLEVFQFPYVPAMQHLARKWEAVRSLKPVGVHQSWLFFGMAGTRAEELAFWAAYEPEKPAEQFLREMAVRDFGPEAADSMLQAWAAMSRAVVHLPAIQLPGYYLGPTFLGPCHPLAPSARDPVPDVFYAHLHYLQEGEETFSVKQIEQARVCLAMVDLPPTSRSVGVIPDDPASDGWELVAREYATAAEAADEALRHVQAAGDRACTKADRMHLQEEKDLTELLYRTFLACANTVEFLHVRRAWETEKTPVKLERLRQIARQERENAAAARPIYARSRWLDPALRLDGQFRPADEMLRAKIAWLDRFLSHLPDDGEEVRGFDAPHDRGSLVAPLFPVSAADRKVEFTFGGPAAWNVLGQLDRRLSQYSGNTSPNGLEFSNWASLPAAGR